VLVMPLAVEIVDRPARVFGDPPAVVRAEARVVVRRVLGEVRGDQIDVARVERLVVAADVVQRVDRRIFTFSLSISAKLVRRYGERGDPRRDDKEDSGCSTCSRSSAPRAAGRMSAPRR
jgi:hypothetical protein